MTLSSPKCLIAARMFVHVHHVLFIILIVWACWSACVWSFEDIQLLLFGSWFIFCQLDGQECLGPFSSYLCYLISSSIHASSQNLNKHLSIPLCEGALGVPYRQRLPSKTSLKISVRPNSPNRFHRIYKADLVFHPGTTKITKSVTPSFPVNWQ